MPSTLKAPSCWIAAAACLFGCTPQTSPRPKARSCPSGNAPADCSAKHASGSAASPAPSSVASAVPSPAFAVRPGPEAVRLDAGQSKGAEKLLVELAEPKPLDSAKPLGEILAGQFVEGQSLVVSLPTQPGACYSVVGLGLAPVARFELALRSSEAPSFGAKVTSNDDTPVRAVVGAGPSCLRWPLDQPGKLELVLTVSSGQGVALARVYEKRSARKNR